jgi:heme/copper-type cytochrome/quinol oxidase subunit 3
MKLPTDVCKKRLTLEWFVGSGLLFFVFLFQTFFGHYGEKASEAWGWLLPSVMPTLLLIASVWTLDALGKGVKLGSVDGFIFWLAFSLSAAYLVVVALTILLQPLVATSPDEYLHLMNQASLFLGPFQGLVSASLGAFFVKSES